MKKSSKGLSLDMFRSGLIVQRIARLLAMVAVLIGGTMLLVMPVRAHERLELIQASSDAPLGVQLPLAVAPISLTHSVSQTIQVGNSEACGSTQSGYTSQNSFWRVYDLDGDFGIFKPFTIDSLIFGVDNTNGIFNVSIRAYSLSGPFITKNLTLISQTNVELDGASNGTFISVDLPNAIIAPDRDLVIEIDVPNGQSQPANFFPASNDLGQTDPSYLSAPGCGFPEPTDLASLGFPDMHLIMTVQGNTDSPTAVTLRDFGSHAAPMVPFVTFATTTFALAGALVYVFNRTRNP
jgi:hypothetical protein